MMKKAKTKYKSTSNEPSVIKENTTAYNPSNNYDEIFKKIWATLSEVGQTLKEIGQKHKEWELEQIKREEERKKWEEEQKKLVRESEKKFRQLESLFIGQWGKLIESLVNGNLENLLKQRGIDISTTTQRVKTHYQGKEYEFDIIAHNGTDIVVVEVKTTLKTEHVKDFIEELKLFKKIFPKYADNNIYGAVAFLVVEEEADKYAYKQGLFVIKATTESAQIINDKKFQPKKW